MIKIDGSFGEGGGQIVRTSLCLSLVTGQPFEIVNIRSGRKKPGLLRQHLTALKAAEEVCNGKSEGGMLKSSSFRFFPGKIEGGRYSFSVGTAGSSTLVLQTILPVLINSGVPVEITLSGGTHNPYAPPFDFIEKVYLDILRDMGIEIKAELSRDGFFPAGGGQFSVCLGKSDRIKKIDLLERGEIESVDIYGISSRIGREIPEKEVEIISKAISGIEIHKNIIEVDSAGPGNVVFAHIRSKNINELFTGFGKYGVSLKKVSKCVVDQINHYQKRGVPVGKYLADQLLIPMALAEGGSFLTMEPTLHTKTNIEIIKRFLSVDIKMEEVEAGKLLVSIKRG